MTVQLEVTTENLLNAVVQMPESEFNSFVKKAKVLRSKKVFNSSLEADLILKINSVFPTDKRQRYNELYAKFQDEKTSENEYQELLQLNDEFESLNNKRLQFIAKLADIRQKSLLEVMKELGISNSEL